MAVVIFYLGVYIKKLLIEQWKSSIKVAFQNNYRIIS